MAEVETERHEQSAEAHGRGETERMQGGERMQGVHSAAHDGVILLRDVATDTVRAAGDVGIAAVDTTRHLLVGVADGVRDVLAHIVPVSLGGHRETGHHETGHHETGHHETGHQEPPRPH